MKTVNETTQVTLDTYGINFPEPMVEQVKRDFLYKRNLELFEGLNDNMVCMQFIYLATAEVSQLGLKDMLTSYIVREILAQQK